MGDHLSGDSNELCYGPACSAFCLYNITFHFNGGFLACFVGAAANWSGCMCCAPTLVKWER